MKGHLPPHLRVIERGSPLDLDAASLAATERFGEAVLQGLPPAEQEELLALSVDFIAYLEAWPQLSRLLELRARVVEKDGT